MRILNGIIIGLLLGLMIGFAAGYNHGRGAPLLSNPFEEHDAPGEVEQELKRLLEETRRAIHDATSE